MILDKNTKTICLILPTLQAGGMERVMAQLANYFVSIQYITVHLILFNGNSKLFYNVDSKVNVHTRNKSNENKLVKFLKTISFIRNSINEINPDAVLSFGTHWNNLVLLALMGTKHKVFISDRGSPTRKYEFPQMLLRRILYPSSKGVIAQTRVSSVFTKKIFPNLPIVTIGNPITTNLKNNGSHNKENIILSVGRLITSKHHDRLISIFCKLNIDNWKLIIVGGNSLKQNNYEKLEQLIINNNLENKVILAGTQKNVQTYYNKSKIFAFTSSSEGFPNVIGEALSAGLPVVSYDCVAGPSDMIEDDENGFLVPVFDDELFQQRLQTLIENEELRTEMGKNAKESMKRFSVETIGDKYLNFILKE